MRFFICILILCCYYTSAQAASGLALKEIAKRIFKTAPKSAGLTMRKINQQLVRLSTRYGDDGVKLASISGYKGLKVITNASDDVGRKLVGVFRRMGARAVPVINNKTSRALFLQYGDNAANAIIRHPGLAEQIIVKYGSKGASLVKGLGDQGAYRLTKLFVRNKALVKNGEKYIDVVQRYGSKALNFIWDHKGALAVASIGATFLNNPEPYINGTVKLASIPLSAVNWNWIAIPLVLILFLAFGGLPLLRRVKLQATQKIH